MPTLPLPPDEATLNAWVDGRLPTAEAEALQAWLATAPATERARVQAWRQQRQHLREWGALLDLPPPPAGMEAATHQAAQAWARQQRWRQGGRTAAMAAAVVMAFGAGWGLRGPLESVPSAATGNGATPAVLAGALPQRFAQQASMAHAVFQPEVRHPVEVTAAEHDHLVAWLSRRLGRALTVPDLRPQGYQLMGGRLLPGDDGARAQFMYQNPAGQRVTLYVGALADPGAAEATGFRFHDDGPVPSFYWVDGGFGYAVSGPLPRTQLWELVHSVHRQL